MTARNRETLVREIAGYVLLVTAAFLFIAVASYHPLDPSPFSAGSHESRNLLSRSGAALAGFFVTVTGAAALAIPFVLAGVGREWLRGRTIEAPGLQAGGWIAALVATDGLLTTAIGRVDYRGGTVELGGELGKLVAAGLQQSMGMVGTVMLCAAVLLAGVVIGLRGSLNTVFEFFSTRLGRTRREMVARSVRWRSLRQREKLKKEVVRRHQPPVPPPPLVLREVEGPGRFGVRRVSRVTVVQDDTIPSRTRTTSRAESSSHLEAVAVQPSFSFVEEASRSILPERTMLLPSAPLTLPSQETLSAMREMVETKCAEFRVEGRVEEVLPGPVITTYEFRPAAGVKYAQVVALEEDLALGLQVEAVRVERIPGKATVGIEVPNPVRQTIVLRDVLESPKFVHSASPLTLALGKDIHGRPYVADLARMPHLLIGGFTGSGKSVGVNAMIMSILFKATPEEVRFILIDPKMVELGMYEKLPHLLTPIITNPRDAALALKWAVRQMRERYTLLASCKVRNLAQFNALVADPVARRRAEEGHEGVELKPLPFIVVIIDELADLMATCAKDVEDSIGQLSQMARAVGIHLLFATQRPSVDIVTGVIKANFSCRIAYKVRTRFDSRTILDSDGAECLLGEGDMLFLPLGSSRPMRLHGCLVREEEILAVLKHLRRLGKPEFDPKVTEERDPEIGDGTGLVADDPMYEQAARLVVAARKASASFIQRKLRLGYARSARLIDMMETEGLVGPAQGSRGREVLVPADFFDEVDSTRMEDGDD